MGRILDKAREVIIVITNIDHSNCSFSYAACRYTQAMISDVVQHAKERGVRIMAEFDGPGHAFRYLICYSIPFIHIISFLFVVSSLLHSLYFVRVNRIDNVI